MSDEIKKEISARIKILREHFSMSPTTFAKETGVEPQTIRDYENGKSIPGGLFLRNLSKLGLNVEWLLTGAGSFNHTDVEFNDKKHIQKIQVAINNLKDASSSYYKEASQVFLNQGNEVEETTENFSNNQSDTIYIEHYTDVRAAAGGGQVTPTDQTILNVAVNAADWRNYVGLNHKHVKIITVYGDSMKPTFAHGDQVLVDTACLAFIDDGVYAIQQGDLLRVKRIKLRLNGSIEVKSDNTQGFANEIIDAKDTVDIKIYGRVLPFKFGKIDL